MTQIQAGVARVVVTPPVGIPMWGFGNRPLPSQSVHDDLTATALVLDDGSTRVGIVAADIIALEPETVAAIRDRASDWAGIPQDNLLLALSHTHSGPLTWRGRGYDDLVEPYCQNFVSQVAGALAWAARELEPARLGFGRGDVQIQVNRREKRLDGTTVIGVNPEGPIDREVGIVRIDAADARPIAALLNYACHPVILGPGSFALSADYVGRTRSIFEAATGARCLFLQGCAGNINPIGGVTDRYDNCERLGAVLAGEALKTFWQITSEPTERIGAARRAFDLPLRRLDPVDAIERELVDLRERAAKLGSEPAPALFVENARFAIGRAELALAEARAGHFEQSIPFEVQALRLGEVGVAGAPAEMFVEIGLRIKHESPFEGTLTLGYANGSVGYLPVADAYPDGGYEVDRAHKGYGELAAVAPTAADTVVATAVELLQGLAR